MGKFNIVNITITSNNSEMILKNIIAEFFIFSYQNTKLWC